MQVRRGFISWGIFLICVGAVPLAVQLNVIDRDTAASLLRLWPLVLIGIGLGLLLRFSRAQALGGFVVAATFGVLVGVFLAGGAAGFGDCGSGPATGQSRTAAGSVVGPTGTRIEMDVSCADVTIAQARDLTWQADVTSERPARVEQVVDRLTMSSADAGSTFPFGGGRESWRVILPVQLDMTYVTLNASHATLTLDGDILLLSGTFNAADVRLDLGSADMGDGPLNMTLNASTARVTLPAGGLGAAGSVTVNASTLDLCSAPELGLRITYDDTLSSQNFAAAGLTQSGKTWQSANYGSAIARAELHISANVSTTNLNPAGGCQ